MDWETDGATGVGDTASDGLTNPPCGIGRELEAFAPVELFDGVHQSEVALLDEVEKRQTRCLILLGNRDDEAQVRLHESALCDFTFFDEVAQLSLASWSEALVVGGLGGFDSGLAGFDLFGESDLIVLGEERVLTDVGQIQADKIFFITVDAILGHWRTSLLRSLPIAFEPETSNRDTDPHDQDDGSRFPRPCRDSGNDTDLCAITNHKIELRGRIVLAEIEFFSCSEVGIRDEICLVRQDKFRAWRYREAMSNPLLNDKRLGQAAAASRDGWAAPDPQTRTPMSDGPVSPWEGAQRAMTVGGTASAAAVLFVLLLAGATVGWLGVDAPQGGVYTFPTFAIAGLLVGFALAIFLAFKPHLAKILAPVYAVAQGLFVGAISRAYETYYDGIVVQAAGATIAVFLSMLALYGLRIIKVTDKFRRTVIGATIGIAVFYGISMLMHLFGATPPFIQSTSVFGIGFSFFVAGLAAFNLALDFDFIERGSKEKMPESVEWFAAFGLLVTVVWLYLEILRLLAKLRER